MADLLATAGADRVLAMTLHSPQVHGFFSVPVDHLHALHELAAHFRGRATFATPWWSRPTWATPRRPRAFARCSAAACRSRRRPSSGFADDKVVISAIIGDVAGRDVIVLDDEIARGSTVIELLDRLRERDVASVRVACTHGLFADGALERLAARDDVAEIVCTNTVPIARREATPAS